MLVSPLHNPLSGNLFNPLNRYLYRRPPCWSDVLAWYQGIVYDDIYLKDSTLLLGDFPLEMVDAACLVFDGIDTITMAGHGTLDSYEGTATPSYNNTTLSATAGTLYNLVFSDGTRWRCAETNPVEGTIYDDTGTYSGTIVSTDLAAMRAGRQSTYFGNALYGWYEKTADNTKYPYPVSGYITYHPGSTWNDSENDQKFKEESVGNFDGVDTLTLYTDHGTLDSDEGNAGVSYVHPTVSATAGWARALTFSDGTIIPLDEGEGTDIHKTVPDLVDAYEFATFGASGSTPDQISIRVYGSDAVANRRYLTSLDANVDVQSYNGIEVAITDPGALLKFSNAANQLTGSIPDLSSYVNLITLDCNANQLTGSIPDLSNNLSFANLYCANNQLTGSIPDLSNNLSLSNFSCKNNQLTDYTGGVTLNFSGLLSFNAANNALTETAINKLLIDFDNGTLVVPTTIDLSGGTNAAPTGAGLTAKASLIAKGHIVTTN